MRGGQAGWAGADDRDAATFTAGLSAQALELRPIVEGCGGTGRAVQWGPVEGFDAVPLRDESL